MVATVTLAKRGCLTLPPALRRRMGLDGVPNAQFLVEERDGGLFLQPAATLPLRDIPKETINAWLARDEAEMVALPRRRRA